MEESFYDRYAALEESHWWFSGRRAIVARAVEMSAPSADADHRILEIGCGTGGMLRMLRRFGPVCGVDVSHNALMRARSGGMAEVIRGDSYALPFAAGSFSMVCAFDVLEHIEDDGRALRELHRVCQPGGHLVVSVPAFPFLWGQQDTVSHHYRRYLRRDIVDLISKAGFVMRYATYFNTWLFPIIAAIRMSRRLRPEAAADATDFDMVLPRPINHALGRLLATEAVAVGRFAWPMGVSLLGVASRPLA